MQHFFRQSFQFYRKKCRTQIKKTVGCFSKRLIILIYLTFKTNNRIKKYKHNKSQIMQIIVVDFGSGGMDKRFKSGLPLPCFFGYLTPITSNFEGDKFLIADILFAPIAALITTVVSVYCSSLMSACLRR